MFSEFIATFGLMAVIWGCSRLRASTVPFAVGAYITAAYWFTSSTSFANPAVTLARAVSNTFSGFRPADVAAFIAAQLAERLRPHFCSGGWFRPCRVPPKTFWCRTAIVSRSRPTCLHVFTTPDVPRWRLHSSMPTPITVDAREFLLERSPPVTSILKWWKQCVRLALI